LVLFQLQGTSTHIEVTKIVKSNTGDSLGLNYLQEPSPISANRVLVTV